VNEDTTLEESRARYAAKKIGLKAKKSRWRANTIDSFGGFMIIDPDRNFIVHGSRSELSAQHVIDYCEGGEAETMPDAEAADRKRVSQVRHY
jgi:hypothetical protein